MQFKTVQRFDLLQILEEKTHVYTVPISFKRYRKFLFYINIHREIFFVKNEHMPARRIPIDWNNILQCLSDPDKILKFFKLFSETIFQDINFFENSI